MPWFQVGSISETWNGVLKTTVEKADRFSMDFPPNIGKEQSSQHQSPCWKYWLLMYSTALIPQ